MSSSYPVYFYYQGKFLSRKVCPWPFPQSIALSGVTVQPLGSEVSSEVDSEEFNLAKAKVDLIFSVWVQKESACSKRRVQLKDNFWSEMVESTKISDFDLGKFLNEETQILDKRANDFFDKIVRDLNAIQHLDEIMNYRRLISSHYVLGSLNNLLIGYGHDT